MQLKRDLNMDLSWGLTGREALGKRQHISKSQGAAFPRGGAEETLQWTRLRTEWLLRYCSATTEELCLKVAPAVSETGLQMRR